MKSSMRKSFLMFGTLLVIGVLTLFAINISSSNFQASFNRISKPAAICGNGTVETGEQCDDGNAISGDGCSSQCKTETNTPPPAVCGNGVQETGEMCDDGNKTNQDGCSAGCTLETYSGPICGNNIVETGETCDDGNNEDGDECSAQCQTEEVEETHLNADASTTTPNSCSITAIANFVEGHESEGMMNIVRDQVLINDYIYSVIGARGRQLAVVDVSNPAKPFLANLTPDIGNPCGDAGVFGFFSKPYPGDNKLILSSLCLGQNVWDIIETPLLTNCFGGLPTGWKGQTATMVSPKGDRFLLANLTNKTDIIKANDEDILNSGGQTTPEFDEYCGYNLKARNIQTAVSINHPFMRGLSFEWEGKMYVISVWPRFSDPDSKKDKAVVVYEIKGSGPDNFTYKKVFDLNILVSDMAFVDGQIFFLNIGESDSYQKVYSSEYYDCLMEGGTPSTCIVEHPPKDVYIEKEPGILVYDVKGNLLSQYISPEFTQTVDTEDSSRKINYNEMGQATGLYVKGDYVFVSGVYKMNTEGIVVPWTIDVIHKTTMKSVMPLESYNGIEMEMQKLFAGVVAFQEGDDYYVYPSNSRAYKMTCQ